MCKYNHTIVKYVFGYVVKLEVIKQLLVPTAPLLSAEIGRLHYSRHTFGDNNHHPRDVSPMQYFHSLRIHGRWNTGIILRTGNLCLFIYDLSNNAVTVSGYIATNDRIISKNRIGKEAILA
jgi:hypothetical protein